MKLKTRDAWSEQGGPFTIEVTSFGYNSSHTNTFGKMFVWGANVVSIVAFVVDE